MIKTDTQAVKAPVVNFLEALRSLQANEWQLLGLKAPEPCQVIDLPDGRPDVLTRLWDVFSHCDGFSNDILFCYTFPTINGEELTSDLQLLYDFCEDAVINHRVSFKVCW